MSNMRCWVPGCERDDDSPVHRLPKNNLRLLKELGFTENFEMPSDPRVCRRHFTADSFIEIAGKLRFGKKVTVLKNHRPQKEESKWFNSCRVCLSGNKGRLVDLFSSSYDLKLNYCAGLEVLREDKLPQKICDECLQKVQAACEIKEKCIETDKLLRELIKPDPDEFDEVDIKIEAESVDSEVEIEVEKFQTQSIDDTLALLIKEETIIDEEFEWPEDPPESTNSEEKSKNAYRRPRAEDYVCVFCQKVFLKITDKLDHMKADHSDELTCPVCEKKKATVVSTERCIKQHTFGDPFLCQICAKPFAKSRSLQNHIARMHTAEKDREKVLCDLCGKEFKNKCSIRRHARTAHLKIKFTCPHRETCPDRFYTTKNSLNIHLYSCHDVPAPFRCCACNSGFTHVSELNVHKRICNRVKHIQVRKKAKTLSVHYDEVNGMLQCKLCPRAFPTKKHFADHFQGYHRDNKTCAICEKTFSCFMAYRKHYKVVHEKIRKFHCDHPGCGKNFSTKGILISHRNTHTGEKPFACNLCSFRTGDYPTLSKHRKKHTQNEQSDSES